MMLAGDHPASYDAFVRAARSGGGTETAFLWYAVRSAAWQGNAARCREGAAMLQAEPANDPMDKVYRQTADAAILALEGHAREAAAALAEALRRWSDLGVEFFRALTALDVLMLLGREVPEARHAAEDARPIFAALGLSRTSNASMPALSGRVAPVMPARRLPSGAPSARTARAASRTV